jgi:type II secretory ATPase GspE/PulE/Tfp pilus assembly ATPase PilB-like protein
LLILKSVEQNCSDVHFEPFENEVKVTFRKRDEISIAFSFPIKSYERIVSRMKYLAGCQNHIQNKPQEGAFRHQSTKIDIRLSTFPSKYGERTALRFINTVQFNDVKSLGWPVETVNEWLKLCSSANGLILITGPVGSGKTTALYATLCELARQKGGNRIVTIEDPVEGRVPEICQSSLEEINNLSLAEAFKHILRQDPDIIALGEIRDSDCVREALQAGLSGHAVFATFHAGSAEEACLRIKQMGIDKYLVFNGLKAILSLELKLNNGKICPYAHLKEIEAE